MTTTDKDTQKLQKLKEDIAEFVDNALIIANQEEKVDYLEINIINHNGTLQMSHTIKRRKKSY